MISTEGLDAPMNSTEGYDASMNSTEESKNSNSNGLDRVILAVYFTASICTFIECLFAVFISRANKRLKKRPSKYFSYSLVLSVGLLSGLSLCYGAVLLIVPKSTHISISGCFVRVIQRCLSTVSCLMLTCLALDRYTSICYPLRYYELITKKRCRILSVICWVSGFLLPILPCSGQLPTFCSDGGTSVVFLASYTVVYNLSAFTMLVFYILVTREFRRNTGSQHQNTALAESEEHIRAKTAKSAMLVLLLYSLLSLPHMIIPLAYRLFSFNMPRFLYHFCHLLHRLHLLLFLPMYVWANADSHEALTVSLRKVCLKIGCNSEGVVCRCLCNVFGYLYEFFCCPSEERSPRMRLKEEFSQVSTISADFSVESRV